ncbi:MAG: 4-hydroxy-tetrahydrodipicolinate synthase [Alphaproteobacteria bacterium]|jgi:4-hydroxy-tetrahydrodipicolinate synthase|nr:4-hydroxy-tetrahydrodipicolinate synthase [Alphaproteobacteria bacterium]MBT5827526.1 4-hydroxy-tetrahydrodipicolinate synthase [Alphaproteobacteria bacterium]
MFKGTYTALITPFSNGKLDLNAYEKIINRQIEAGISGLVPSGTTGESPTLSHDEHNDVIRTCVELSKGKVKIIAGTGSNSTTEAIYMTKHAEKVGADAALIVAPYYNKPSQRGLYEHFKSIHDNTNIPIILYNIPGRSVVNIDLELMANLAKLPRIIGVKDATADLTLPQKIKNLIGNDFIQLSGEDGSVIEYNKQGGVGVISVTANIAPELCVAQQNAFFANDLTKADNITKKLAEINEVLFCETNPMPVKFAAELLGLCTGELRLPLIEVEKRSQEKIKRALKNLALI